MRRLRSHIGVFAVIVLSGYGGVAGVTLARLCCTPNATGVDDACPHHTGAPPAPTEPDATSPVECPMHQAGGSQHDGTAPSGCCPRMCGCTEAPGSIAFASFGPLTPAVTVARSYLVTPFAFAVTPISPQVVRRPAFPPPRVRHS